MRVSTSMLWDSGVTTINNQTASLLNIQQQVASGRRIVTPSSDPVGAARALDVSQAIDVNAQFSTNHGNATSALSLMEAQLSSAGDVLGRVRELAVQAGNSMLSANDKRSVANELRARFDELLGLANSTDGSGQYLFSGYMGSTRPFDGNVDQLNAAAANEVTYQGDDGQRLLQVAATRQLAISDAGSDVFTRIRNGNGYFTTTYGSQNAGTGLVDGGSITDPSAWNTALASPAWAAQVPPATPNDLEIRFWTDTNGIMPVPAKKGDIYYDIIDSNGTSLYTGQKSTTPDEVGPATPDSFSAHKYSEGQQISLNGLGGVGSYLGFNLDFGANVIVTGTPQGSATTNPLANPATQDGFKIAPSTTQSIFKTLATLIGTLERGGSGAAGQAKYSNDVGAALTNFNQMTDNLLRVRASIGSRLAEVESLSDLTQDLSVQYQQTLSGIQDLDYAKAITDLSRKQVDLDAAQKSFMKVSQLSLFNYL